MQRRSLLKLAALSTIGLARAQAAAKPDPSPSIHNTEPITMDDVIIIGGSFAGHAHGLLGHDHKPPLDILAEARQQLARYPAIKLVSARAESVSGAIDD